MSGRPWPARAPSSDEYAPDPARATVEPSWEGSGGLQIKERRAWATWQLSVAVAIAVLLGMAIGHTGDGGTSGASGGAPSGFQIPTASGGGSSSSSESSSATTTTPSRAAQASSPTAAGASASSTPTTAPTPSSVSVAGPGTVLLPRTTGSGGQTLTSFNATGPWKLGWAFQCAGGPGFQVLVVPEGGSPPSQPTVDRSEPQSSGVAEVSTSGRLHLEVRASPACRWAVKASGGAG